MPNPYEKISRAIAREKIVYSIHADDRLRQRGVVRWQIVAGFADGELIRSHPGAQPNPKIVMKQQLADGTEVIAIWSFVASLGCAKLVTVFFEEAT